MWKKRRYLLIIAVVLPAVGFWMTAAPARSAQPKAKSIVVTTSMLASAVLDLADEQYFHVVPMQPPGACPGHYDVKPDVLPVLKQAVAIIRHDYQTDLEQKIVGLGRDPIEVLTVRTPGSLLLPENYVGLLEQVCGVLAAQDPVHAGVYQKNLADRSQHVRELKRTLADVSKNWQGQPVIAAEHQTQFAEALGFRVIGVLKRGEDMTPADLQALWGQHARMVIGNLQSNAEEARALGQRLHVPVAIVSNFPGVPGYGATYEELVMNNLEIVEQAWNQP